MSSPLVSAFTLSALLALASVGCASPQDDGAGATAGAVTNDAKETTVRASTAKRLSLLEGVWRVHNTEAGAAMVRTYEHSVGDPAFNGTSVYVAAVQDGDASIFDLDVDITKIDRVEAMADGVKILGSRDGGDGTESFVALVSGASSGAMSAKIGADAPRVLGAPSRADEMTFLSSVYGMKRATHEGSHVTARIFESAQGDPLMNGDQLYLHLMVRADGAEDRGVTFDLDLDVASVTAVTMNESEIRITGTEERDQNGQIVSAPFTRTIRYSVRAGAPASTVSIAKVR